jgi:hypothetical protein
MRDELIARAALLVGVALAGEYEGVLDRLPIQRARPPAVSVAGAGIELLDQCEEVAEESPLLVRKAGGDVVGRQDLVVGGGCSDLRVPAAVGGDLGPGLLGP